MLIVCTHFANIVFGLSKLSESISKILLSLLVFSLWLLIWTAHTGRRNRRWKRKKLLLMHLSTTVQYKMVYHLPQKTGFPLDWWWSEEALESTETIEWKAFAAILNLICPLLGRGPLLLKLSAIVAPGALLILLLIIVC